MRRVLHYAAWLVTLLMFGWSVTGLADAESRVELSLGLALSLHWLIWSVAVGWRFLTPARRGVS